MKQGYAAVRVDKAQINTLHNLPIHILTTGKLQTFNSLSLGQEANFFLKKNNEIQYAVINGYLIDLNQELPLNMKQIVR
ncbi:hypothetical protein D3C81_2123420 [compost metagenome]